MCVLVRPDPVFIVVGLLVVFIELWTLYHFNKFADFAVQLISTCREVGKVHTGVYKLAAATIVAQMVWMGVYLSVTARTLAMFDGAAFYAVGIHSIFTFYWVAETIRNITHVTVAGSLATWYFAGDEFRQSNPTWQALKRSTTYSFGSICLASLLVAILQTLRRIFRMLQSENRDNIWLVILSIVARIMLVVIEALLRFFNKYVLTMVAIYGCSYWDGVKRTRTLFGSNGFEMVMQVCSLFFFLFFFQNNKNKNICSYDFFCLLLQNNITVTIISASALIGGFTCAGVGALMAHAAGKEVALLAAAGFVLGLFIVEGSFVLLESGSISVMLCYLLHPAKLQQSRPELYELMLAAEQKFGGGISRATV